MFLCTVASELRNYAICQLVYLLRKDTVTIRQDVLIFWKPVNFIAEMQGCHAICAKKRYVIFTIFTHQVS